MKLTVVEAFTVINVVINGLRLLLEWIKDFHHSKENNRPDDPDSLIGG